MKVTGDVCCLTLINKHQIKVTEPQLVLVIIYLLFSLGILRV